MNPVIFGLSRYASLAGLFAAFVLMSGQGYPAAEPAPPSSLASRPGAVKNHNTIAAGGSAMLPIEPKDEWFRQAGAKPSFRGIFKDDQVDGFLLVYHASDDAKQAGRPLAKLFRVKTTLAYYDPATKAFLSYSTLIFLLVLGALASLYINYKFPDEQIRNELRQQLVVIGDGIESLSMRLASRLRVLVGVERRALGERLKRLRWYSTDFESQRAEIAGYIACLKRRVDLLEQMGRLRNEYEQLLTLEVPPTIMDRLENLFEQTGKLLEAIQTSETDLQEATLKLAEIRKTLSGWSQPDPALAAQISASLTSLAGDLQPSGGVLANSPTFQSIRGEFTSLITPLSAIPQTQIPATDYYRWDCLAFRLLSLRTYALLCDARNPPADSLLVTRRSELFSGLKTESWEGLKCTRRLVWEMSEVIYADDVQSQFENKQIEIRLDRNQVRMFEPAQFYLTFVDKKFDSATAKDEWSCTWNFGHGPFRGKNDDPKNFLEETGWSVAHYFPVADTYTVKVRFRHEQRGELKGPDTLPATVDKDVFVGNAVDSPELTGWGVWIRSRSNKLTKWTGENGHAIARLALALVPAILALVTGAKDQILKMDLFPAFCAVFLAGFGSDQVKNLLSQKPRV